MSLPAVDGSGIDAPDTRRRILIVASDLFARKGYHGTSTREIAEAVGIRQPSLFHHFQSKAAMMEALISVDLDQAVPVAEALASQDAPAAERLYRYLVDDVEHLVNSPFNLSGLYTDEIAGNLEFEASHRKRRRLHAAIEAMVEDGVRRGEFVPSSPSFVREAIVGMMLRTLSRYSGGREQAEPDLGDRVGAFVLRALLVNGSDLVAVRRRARSLDLSSPRRPARKRTP